MKTPQISYPKLAEVLNVKEIHLKREDKHKYGSHKGRSIPQMIKKYLSEGWENFVISSSGNAALAAINFVQKHNKNNNKTIYLSVFVGSHIEDKKMDNLKKIIKDESILLTQTEKPKQQAFKLDKENQAKFLRQSTDESALVGYYELAEELDKIEDLEAIFVPTSSGTTAEALGLAFKDLKNNPQIHIVQTSFCHPIACKFDNDFISTNERSIAGAIVDKVAHRKNEVLEIIKNSGGSGWVVSDGEIRQAQQEVKETTGISISTNSALSVAGLKKARATGWEFDGAVSCLVTGR